MIRIDGKKYWRAVRAWRVSEPRTDINSILFDYECGIMVMQDCDTKSRTDVTNQQIYFEVVDETKFRLARLKWEF